MKTIVPKFPMITLLVLLIPDAWTAPSTKSSWLSPKALNQMVETFSPVLQMLPSVSEARSGSSKLSLKDLQKTLSFVAEQGESWGQLAKRVGTLLLTKREDLALRKDFFNGDLVQSLFSASPQFLKDAVQAKLQGSIWPSVKDKLHKIIETIKDSSSNSSSDKVDSKQGGVLFDPVVFGSNALLNLLYTSAFTAFVTPTMGLDNLFNPDYDFDYDSLKEGKENHDNEEAATDQSNSTENSSLLNGPAESENQVYAVPRPMGSMPSYNGVILGGPQDQKSSSYLHYSGQRLRPHPNQVIQSEDYSEQPHYLFRMYKPNGHMRR